jgi:hypothetical protein
MLCRVPWCLGSQASASRDIFSLAAARGWPSAATFIHAAIDGVGRLRLWPLIEVSLPYETRTEAWDDWLDNP